MVCRLVCIEARRRVGAPMELRRRADNGGAGVATEDLFILNTFIFLVGLQVPGTDVELENDQRGDRPRAKKTTVQEKDPFCSWARDWIRKGVSLALRGKCELLVSAGKIRQERFICPVSLGLHVLVLGNEVRLPGCFDDQC